MSFYVLSKAGDTFINVESFEYVYVADDDTIKAIAGQKGVWRMTDLVKCDRCGTPFSIQTAGIRSTWSGDYMVQYFTCPGCHHRYQILTTDTELRQTVQQHKKIAAKIRMGKSKNFRPGTLKKYQAEMEKLEAEQKKRRDELMDKGNEILAQLGEE